MIKLVNVGNLIIDPETFSPMRDFTFRLEYEQVQDQMALDLNFYENLGKQLFDAMKNFENSSKD